MHLRGGRLWPLGLQPLPPTFANSSLSYSLNPVQNLMPGARGSTPSCMACLELQILFLPDSLGPSMLFSG